ncbi:MAG: ClbS/DfsB family four-helix bundle protein [Thermales bacterium]|nr:ClbS/DfsB family four-helix bundle protein [Thermales bacterium]
MPAAKNTKDLLITTKLELQKLQDTLKDIDEKSSSWTSSEDDSSIKQIIAHRTEWMKMFFVWYQDGVEGKEPQVPAPGYKWNQLKEYNTMIWERDKKNLGMRSKKL